MQNAALYATSNAMQRRDAAVVLASLLAASCSSLRIRRDAACDEVMAAFDTCTEA